MTLMVERFNEALNADGPDAVAIYNSGQLLLEEYYTLGKIARGGLGVANINANTRLCTATTAAALMIARSWQRAHTPLEQLLQPLIALEIASVAAIDAAIARERHPDYVVMFQSTKTGKQANVEQMASLIWMQGGRPPSRAASGSTC
jgi:predicted molibdopterin-dependent oxidoreductase YjgC